MTTLTLCRFNDAGILCKHDIDIEKDAYLAISHLWGEPREQSWVDSFPGIPWEVLASPQKADFLRTRLRDLVGKDYFWMDILCVNQRSEDDKIRVVRHIPAIYRGAERTIVIRESGGFLDCCARAISDESRTWSGEDGGKRKFQRHIQDAHRWHALAEAWFERLWVLQEALLSDTLQFSMCGNVIPTPIDPFDDIWNVTRGRHLMDSLEATAHAWIEYGNEGGASDAELDEFVHAFLHFGTVTRPDAGVDRYQNLSLLRQIDPHMNSVRKTTKDRDFILATFPQFDWYVLPENVRTMDFGSLWLDCYTQAASAGQRFHPRIAAGMVSESASGDESRLPTSEIPTPTCLGDFVKLFGCSSSGAPYWGRTVNDVELRNCRPSDVTSTLETIRCAMDFQQNNWFFACRGDLNQYGSFPRTELLHVSSTRVVANDEEEPELNPEVEGLKALSSMWFGIFEEPTAMHGDWNYYSEWLSMMCTESYAEILLRIAALVSCGIGVSALQWSRGVLMPVEAIINGHTTLALLSKEYWETLDHGGDQGSDDENHSGKEEGDLTVEAISDGESNELEPVSTSTSEPCATDAPNAPEEPEEPESTMEGLSLELSQPDNGSTSEKSWFLCAQRGTGTIPRDLVIIEQDTQKVIGIFPDIFVDWKRSEEERADRYMDLCVHQQRQLWNDRFLVIDFT